MFVTAAGAPGSGTPLDTIADPTLWAITIGAIIALFGLDFLITRRPHKVVMKEAIGWSIFYIALPVLFGVWVWLEHGGETGLQYYTGYIVEKSLSVDNLFVFLLLLTAFAVPAEYQQRVLLIGIAGALVLRAIFIALGAQLIASFSWAFLLFGAILLVTAVKVFKDASDHEEKEIDIGEMRVVKLMRRVWPVESEYHGTKLSVKVDGRRAITPMALVIVAILTTDVVFAIDSVPAVYGITADPYLVFVTNAFALLGLRALYFVVAGALASLAHLGYGLAVILAFIGIKLVLHWAHGIWPQVPEVPTLPSLLFVVGVLLTVTATSLYARRRERGRLPRPEVPASRD